MTNKDRLDERLERAGTEISGQPSIVGDVMGRIQDRSVAPVSFGVRARRWLLRPAISVPLYVLLGVVVFAILSRESKPLYAQVIEALERARSVHMTVETWQDGRSNLAREAWWQDGVGLADYTYLGNECHVIIDNGEFEWRYAVGGDLVWRTPSLEERQKGLVSLAAGMGIKLMERSEPVRDPSGDRAIDGVNCLKFAFSDPVSGSYWIDKSHRVRLFEVEYASFKVRVRLEYDIEIEPSRFTPPPAREGIEVVDTDEYLARQYSLGKSLFVREAAGFTFAVHELTRCGEGLLVCVSSIRPSEDYQPEISSADSVRRYGTFGARLPEFVQGVPRIHVLPLAEMAHNDLLVKWHLLIDQDAESLPGQYVVNFYVTAHRDLERRLEAEGRPTVEWFDVTITAQEPSEPWSLEEALGEIHAKGRRLDPLVSYFSVVGPPVLTEKGSPTHDRVPATITRDEYVEETRRRILEVRPEVGG